MKRILVTGTSRPWDGAALRAARMVGRTLAERGLGMVTGNATGVDKAAAASFCSHLTLRGGDVVGRYTQLALRFHRRGSFWPFPGYAAGTSRVKLSSTDEWLEQATARCAAAVMVGGHAGRMRGALAGGGALRIVNRFIEEGKPVFPIPFSGGDSDEVFQDVLARWHENRIPKLSREQFLRLALPWTAGSGDFAELLLGSLAETPDVFISYRRTDTAWASGRLHRDLSEHFGAERVFMDLEDIAPGDEWNKTLEDALRSCKVGVVFIGTRWLEIDSQTQRPRLHNEGDIVRMEIGALLVNHKPIIMVLAGADLPSEDQLPEDLRSLCRLQAIAVSNGNWEIVVEQIIRTIERALTRPRS